MYLPFGLGTELGKLFNIIFHYNVLFKIQGAAATPSCYSRGRHVALNPKLTYTIAPQKHQSTKIPIVLLICIQSVFILLSRRAPRQNNVPIRGQSEIFKEATAKNVKNIHVESRDYTRARPSVDIETVSHEIAYRTILTQIL